ncbi:MAG: aminotransferase class I/II-fold pyridoxal phosphate-dependent enzyme [Crocinitomicaceae bacterium]
MAKIVHNSIHDTINDLLIEAEQRGVIQLKYTSDEWSGDTMAVGDKLMRNFGTCGYLGLENHPTLIEKSIEFTQKYGTQFSVSRTYLASKHSEHLESLLSSIFFNKPVITFTSTSLLHVAVIPSVIETKDVIILDQQCHVSIQTACQLLKAKGTTVDIIRHNNLEMLEQKILKYRDTCSKIWYMIDGVYSMYGDIAPIDALNQFMIKYPQLHLYVDDAHGMSWSGTNGCGQIYEACLKNGKTLYMSTMAKGFGVMGGIAVFPDMNWYQKVKIHGGALSYSHPIPPPIMGACIASAELHLNGSINALQNSLHEKLSFADVKFNSTDLPLLSNPNTPIKFVGTGQPVVGYNLNKRILDEGFYVNIGMFPAVPIKNTGLRFTITNHNSNQDISDLIDALAYHYPLALAEEEKTNNQVRKAFNLPLLSENETDELDPVDKPLFTVQREKTIKRIDQQTWDTLFMGKGNFDFEGLQIIEEGFSSNEKIEENWESEYILIRDQKEQVVLATFFTTGIVKDDLLSEAGISKSIEELRKEEPYYLCSKTLCLGSFFTEGEHLYYDKQHPLHKDAVHLLLQLLLKTQQDEGINNLILRDFSEDDHELFKLFYDEGFFKVQMPNANIITNLQEEKDKEYIELLSPKARRNIRSEVIKHLDLVTFEIKKTLTEEELHLFYSLYKQVAAKNFDINIFQYPFKLFQKINESTHWEFGVLRVKETNEIIGIEVCNLNGDSYVTMIMGFDDSKNLKYSVYKTILYFVVIHARLTNFQKLYFGFSADFEKKKLGSKQISKFAFVSTKDQFTYEQLETKH